MNNTLMPGQAYDKNSLMLCAITYGMKMFTFFLNVSGTLGNVATFIAIMAGASTLTYNIIKIYESFKSK